MSQNKDCFKLLRNASPTTIVGNAPSVIDSYYLPVVDHVAGGLQASGVPKAGALITSLFLGWKNNMSHTAQRAPFCVGETVRLQDGAAFVEGTIAAINYTAIAGPSNQIELVFTAAGMVRPLADIAAGTVVYSMGYSQRGAGKDPSFLVSDVSMVIQEIQPEPSYISAMEKSMRQNGGLSYKCHAWQNYRHSVSSSENTATVNLNILQHMAKALMVVPTSQIATTLDGAITQYGGGRTGISGIMDTLTSLQFFYAQKFQPDRPINTDLVSNEALEVFNGEFLCELEKSMAFFGIPASHTLLNLKKNMVYPRALALMNQVVNLADSGDFQIICNYSAPVVSKLLNCWIAGIREFKATPQGVVVTY